MVRLIKKGLYIFYKLMDKVEKFKELKKKKVIKIWFCFFMIYFDMVGEMIVVYNGKIFVFVFVIENMVGYKLGEFLFIWIFKGYIGNCKK